MPVMQGAGAHLPCSVLAHPDYDPCAEGEGAKGGWQPDEEAAPPLGAVGRCHVGVGGDDDFGVLRGVGDGKRPCCLLSPRVVMSDCGGLALAATGDEGDLIGCPAAPGPLRRGRTSTSEGWRLL